MSLSSHVLDTARGRPAAGVPILWEARNGTQWMEVARAITNDDGRVRFELPLTSGDHRLRFDVAAYFHAHAITGFYPYVEVVFSVSQPTQHHHVPLLLSPYGYSTYRGS